ncbi:MAG: WYL domain-containing protein [Cellvibrionaceae bacterium]|nr:WYL domain-containing protein [Cellvibrionaceae bacterium]
MEFNKRFWLIELLAYWEGRVNTTSLIHHFGLSRQQSSADLNAYSAQAPTNLTYDASTKAYLPKADFQRHFISDDVGEYLGWMQNPSAAPAPISAPSAKLSNLALRLPPRKVAPELMRGLVAATRQRLRIEVDYVSLTNPNREGRVIAPHTFVNTGLRWHLRAWCEKSRGYRDFVLSRFRGVPTLLDKTQHPIEHDVAWNTQITIILQPDPRLTPAQQEVLENDYQMLGGQLHITTKACMVNYLLKEMQVNTKMLDGTPEAQQLVLVNREDIRPWLFD